MQAPGRCVRPAPSVQGEGQAPTNPNTPTTCPSSQYAPYPRCIVPLARRKTKTATTVLEGATQVTTPSISSTMATTTIAETAHRAVVMPGDDGDGVLTHRLSIIDLVVEVTPVQHSVVFLSLLLGFAAIVRRLST